jgi:hypothetical protein
VADRERVKKSIRQLQRVKTWQLLIIFILMAFVAATFLRLNSIEMAQRREGVLAADKTGDVTTIQNRLYDLQRYVAMHMNSNTEQFYLEQQYRRDVQKAVDAAKDDGNPNGNVNVKAEAVCRPQFTVWSSAYVQCFANELSKYPPSPDPTQNVTLPSVGLYRHDFASPLWTPDFAGWSVLVCAIILLMIITRLASLGILRLLLRKHYRGI